MGNVLFCEKCETGESIINLSDTCVYKLTKDDKKKKCGTMPWRTSKLKDDEWMKKLKCLDDIHTLENGLTQQAVDCLLCTVEMETDTTGSSPCPTKELINCLKNQKNCLIMCKKFMDDFIDCVDTQRINAIKGRIEEEKIAAEREARAVKKTEE